MVYISQHQYRDGTIQKTIVEIRRRDAGNYDALFLGMGENGKEIGRAHV